jgi:hypothetical protein
MVEQATPALIMPRRETPARETPIEAPAPGMPVLDVRGLSKHFPVRKGSCAARWAMSTRWME